MTVEAIDGDLPTLAEIDARVPRLRWQDRSRPLRARPDRDRDRGGLRVRRRPLRPRYRRAAGYGIGEETSPPRRHAPARPQPGSEATGPASSSDGGPRSARRAHDDPRRPRARRPAREPRRRARHQPVDAGAGMAAQRTSTGVRGRPTLDELQQLTRDMQDSVMAIRAQPVESLFQRMTRIVREAAQATGKQVALETEGEATEIDKTVVERLAEPLTHMIRNAIDHGIESPEASRAAAGKPATGTVRLTARQQSDRVVIEVSDDGRGIDRPRVLARAVERGLVPRQGDARAMPRSTGSSSCRASRPRRPSPRCRGAASGWMSCSARSAISPARSRSLRRGAGSTISVSLPLTLAILDGMIVRSRRSAWSSRSPRSSRRRRVAALVETLAGTGAWCACTAGSSPSSISGRARLLGDAHPRRRRHRAPLRATRRRRRLRASGRCDRGAAAGRHQGARRQFRPYPVRLRRHDPRRRAGRADRRSVRGGADVRPRGPPPAP